MRKIKAEHNNKDRIICSTSHDQMNFYYLPAGSTEKFWLFSGGFDNQIFWYFRTYGRAWNDRGFSLTLAEIYRFKAYRLRKLTQTLARIPLQVEYVIKECMGDAGSAWDAEEPAGVTNSGFGTLQLAVA